MLTAFLALIGCGYLIAVANIHQRHALADGAAGLSMKDLRAVYSGLSLSAEVRSEIPSRMLTMVRGEMRQYLSSDENFAILESWLKEGGRQEDLDKGPPRKTPRRVLIRDCLRCHARSTGTQISRDSPFGADEFDVDYALLARLASGQITTSQGAIRLPPQYNIPRLVLVSHQHVLTIPVFTLIVGALFSLTRLPAGIRGALAPLPMLALLLDFAGWWLARIADASVFLIAGAGAVFGLAFGAQVIVIAIDLWRPAKGHAETGPS